MGCAIFYFASCSSFPPCLDGLSSNHHGQLVCQNPLESKLDNSLAKPSSSLLHTLSIPTMSSHLGQSYVGGVNAVLASAKNICSSLHLFSMARRVAAITGGRRGIGLEMALAYAEAGAVVYCIDLPSQPDTEFCTVQAHVAGLPKVQLDSVGRLEYIACDVTKQKEVWDVMEQIAAKEGRLDVCIACAGIAGVADVLDYPDEDFQKVNVITAIILLTYEPISHLRLSAGHGGQRQRCLVHSARRGEDDGQI